MAHIQPTAEHMVMYHIETNCGTEMIPESVCGHIGLDMFLDDVYDQVGEYLEGSEVYSFERAEGWYARLSAPGYLDCTDWMGDYPTEEEALTAIKDLYDVDDNGDELPEGE